MKTRNRALLASAIIALGAPAAASAECPPLHNGEEEVVVEVDITFQGSPIGVPVLSDQVVSVEYPNPGPAVMPDGPRDPANSMIQRIGLVEDPAAQN